MKHPYLAFTLLTFFAACGGDDAPTATPQPPGDNAPMDEHGTPHELGTIAFVGLEIQAVQFGDIVAGKDAAFDFRFADDVPRPEVLRGWIGKEDAVGSRKATLENELYNMMHGHIEIPDPIPADSKLWLEIEQDAGPARASIALHK